MQKTRIRYCASILLVLMLILTPLRFLRAADAEANVEANNGNFTIYSIKNNTDKEMSGWTVTIKGVPVGTYTVRETAPNQEAQDDDNVSVSPAFRG